MTTELIEETEINNIYANIKELVINDIESEIVKDIFWQKFIANL